MQAVQIQKASGKQDHASCTAVLSGKRQTQFPSSLLYIWTDHTSFLRKPKAKKKAVFPQTIPSQYSEIVIKYKSSHTVKPAELLPSPITLWQIK